MISEASAAISSIKAAIDIAKGAAGVKTATEINLAIIDIQRALLDAQSAAFDDHERQTELQRRIKELETQLAQVHNWEAEKGRYQLTETITGTLVYALKPECANGDPNHRLCVKCFNEDRKSVLQVVNRHSGGEIVQCPHCKVKLTVSPFPDVTNVSFSNGQSWLG